MLQYPQYPIPIDFERNLLKYIVGLSPFKVMNATLLLAEGFFFIMFKVIDIRTA